MLCTITSVKAMKILLFIHNTQKQQTTTKKTRVKMEQPVKKKVNKITHVVHDTNIDGKGSSNWFWSTWVQSCFFSFLKGRSNIVFKKYFLYFIVLLIKTFLFLTD